MIYGKPKVLIVNSYSKTLSAVAPRRVVAKVLRQRETSPSYWRLELQNAYIAENACAGQFVHLLPRAANLSDPLLRRAFSVLRTEDNCFEILYRVGGKGTQNMTQLAENDELAPAVSRATGISYTPGPSTVRNGYDWVSSANGGGGPASWRIGYQPTGQ